MIMNKEIFEFEKDNITYYYIRARKADNIWVETDSQGKPKFTGVFNCSRCGGQGQSFMWKRDNGICYGCHGLGYTTVTLDVTKNKSTAERRLEALKVKAKKQEEEEIKRCEQRRAEAKVRNTAWTLKTYSENFYVILDTLEKSTYEEREYIKSKGGRWNYSMSCWWVKASDTVEEDFKDFKIYKLPTEKLLKDNGELDTSRINLAVIDYNYELNKKKRGGK